MKITMQKCKLFLTILSMSLCLINIHTLRAGFINRLEFQEHTHVSSGPSAAEIAAERQQREREQITQLESIAQVILNPSHNNYLAKTPKDINHRIAFFVRSQNTLKSILGAALRSEDTEFTSLIPQLSKILNYEPSMLISMPCLYDYSTWSVSALKKLREMGANINGLMPDGNGGSTTYLHLLSANGHTQSVINFIAVGAHIDALDSCMETPLFVACKNENVGTAKALLAHGAQTKLSIKNGTTLLIQLAVNGNADSVYALTHNNVDPNMSDQHKMTPLMAAAKAGNLDAASALLTAGANPKLKDDHGKTAFDYAKEHKQFSMVTYLMMRSAVNNIAEKLESFGA